MNPPPRIHLSRFLSIPFSTIVYALSGAVVGTSAFPSTLVVAWAVRTLLSPPSAGPMPALLSVPPSVPSAGHLFLFCLVAGGSLYLVFFCGLLVTGLFMRLLSLGVRPGRHKLFSGAGAMWMAMNGVQSIAARLFLPAVPGGYFSTMYFRLAGCRIGKDVWIIGATILDPHLVSIGDGTVIGGDAVISPHIAGGTDVLFGPIAIGADCRIGAHSVICAGVTVGNGATVGIRAFLRKGTSVPPGAHVAAPGAMSPREVVKLEKGSRRG